MSGGQGVRCKRRGCWPAVAKYTCQVALLKPGLCRLSMLPCPGIACRWPNSVCFTVPMHAGLAGLAGRTADSGRHAWPSHKCPWQLPPADLPEGGRLLHPGVQKWAARRFARWAHGFCRCRGQPAGSQSMMLLVGQNPDSIRRHALGGHPAWPTQFAAICPACPPAQACAGRTTMLRRPPTSRPRLLPLPQLGSERSTGSSRSHCVIGAGGSGGGSRVGHRPGASGRPGHASRAAQQ